MLTTEAAGGLSLALYGHDDELGQDAAGTSGMSCGQLNTELPCLYAISTVL